MWSRFPLAMLLAVRLAPPVFQVDVGRVWCSSAKHITQRAGGSPRPCSYYPFRLWRPLRRALYRAECHTGQGVRRPPAALARILAEWSTGSSFRYLFLKKRIWNRTNHSLLLFGTFNACATPDIVSTPTAGEPHQSIRASPSCRPDKTGISSAEFTLIPPRSTPPPEITSPP